MPNSSHDQASPQGWATLTEAQRRGYSSAVDQHLNAVQAQVNRVCAEITTTQAILKRHCEAEQTFNAVTAPDSSLCVTLHQWTLEWRAEERSLKPLIDQAHHEHSQSTQEGQRVAKEARQLNTQLTLLLRETKKLLEDSSQAEKNAREEVRAHHERDQAYRNTVGDIRELSQQLSMIEVDKG